MQEILGPDLEARAHTFLLTHVARDLVKLCTLKEGQISVTSTYQKVI